MKSLSEIMRNIHTGDIRWSEDYLSTTPFSSAYWVRKRLGEAIAAHARFAHGTLLDVGCGLKPYERIIGPFVDRYIGLEYSPESGYRGNRADICGDAAALPLADESVDTVLCTEVMVNLPDPEKTIAEFARVLTPGGTVITTAPFVYPVHDKNDFFRYSPDGLPTILRRCGLTVETVYPLSGTAVTLAVMLNLYWYDAGFMWTKWLYPIGLVLRPVLWLLCFFINIIGGLFELILPDKHLSFSHLTVATKEFCDLD
ncbi:MAG TPA: class I SAM-dependent methyltransferase [Pyrinomonadaceae bacterium]|nr:class I SAM-dependent methyltransferase [Pyrinomonadaceae bacterium]